MTVREQSPKVKAILKTLKSNYASYGVPSHTDIPVELAEYFEDMGFTLKWVRTIDPDKGGVDLKNLSTKRQKGWEPVTHKELESLNMPGISDMWGSGANPGQKGWITVGDVALFKRESEISEVERKLNDNEAWRQINDLKKTLGDLRKDGINVDKYSSSFNQRKGTRFGNGQEVADLEVETE